MMVKETEEILCSSCQSLIPCIEGNIPKYCCFCGKKLSPEEDSSLEPSVSIHDHYVSSTLIHGHVPKPNEIQFSVGPYQILKEIGKGGMGEVFIAYDPTCGRRIALKRIREDLIEHKNLHRRFLKEARVTSQLTHPAIIPIYAIHDEEQVYYTMPYVLGDTLKAILRETRRIEKKGEKSDFVGCSIPALVRIFITICQAIAYAHSKGVLHRDIKPENVIVGHYGEVIILDWGLAKLLQREVEDEEEEIKSDEHPLHEITRIGKVVGTVNYMSPERALGQPATVESDIYALGVTLYQILTLQHPFKRGTLSKFRENLTQEVLPPPTDIAPYRDVPRMLSTITTKCLEPKPEDRYQTVEELINDLENFIEGRSEWFPIATLDIKNQDVWEFQENVLIAEHMAVTRATEVSDWVNLMISKDSYTQNTKIEATVKIGDNGHGIGFLLSVPEPSERIHLNDGYCLWLSSDISKSTKLLRSTVEVMTAPEIYLERGKEYLVCIEKVDNNLYFYLNEALQFSYISHLPLTGTHLGLLSRDADFSLEHFQVFVGNLNITVNCLAVPDAFLAHKQYAAALSEYRRIGYSFPGRAEGREALFRAGITILEEAKTTKKTTLFEAALEEFEKLHGTPGAPLEYLGKALVYRSQKDYSEEIKCLELALRRYPLHPLLPLLQEQVIWRMHECSRAHRTATYNFILVAVRQLPDTIKGKHTRRLFSSVQKYWEPLPFFLDDPRTEKTTSLKEFNFAIKLAFWLARPYSLMEIIEELKQIKEVPTITLSNSIWALIELGACDLAESVLKEIDAPSLEKVIAYLKSGNVSYPKDERAFLYILEDALFHGDLDVVHDFTPSTLSSVGQIRYDALRVWLALLEKDWESANEIFNKYPLADISKDTSAFHWLYGIYLYVQEGKEIASIHFAGLLDESFPRTSTLLGHYLKGKIHENHTWFKKAFLWEKRQLFRQLTTLYTCLGESSKVEHYRSLEKQQYLHNDS